MPNELWIYDVIGEGLFEAGVTAKSVRDDLKKLDKKEPLLVRINSPGGSVRDAVAITALLNDWEAGVDVQVDGLAASAASYIAMAGRNIDIVEGSFFMVHQPWTLAIGSAKEMREAADYLDKAGEMLSKAYVRRTGKSQEEITAMLDAETWLTADEAVQHNFANAKIETIPVAAYVIPEKMGFRNAPEPALAKPKHRNQSELAAMQQRLRLATSA